MLWIKDTDDELLLYAFEDDGWKPTGMARKELLEIIAQLQEEVFERLAYMISGPHDNLFIELLKKYIDNNTIYWDEENQVVKARNAVVETYTISLDVNPANIGQASIMYDGDVINAIENEENGSYLYTILKGGSFTINIGPDAGYAISRLNVDRVDQGAINTYTFSDVQNDHTMYLWLEELPIEQTDVDFLVRSDAPEVYYSSLGACLLSVQADYPEGLTQDVTVKCIKNAMEVRGSIHNSDFGVWVSKLSNWNKDSIYSLNINGDGLYTIDCRWLGGIFFENVDNIYLRGVNFINYANYSGQHVPDEVSAIFFRGTDESKVKNIAMYDCKLNGFYQNTDGYRAFAHRCCVFKKAENVIIDSCVFEKAAAAVILINETKYIEITRNVLQGDYYTDSTLGHAFIGDFRGVDALLKMHDNTIDGVTLKEYTFLLSGFRRIDIQRNIIKNCAGQVFNIAADLEDLIIGSNVFYNNVTNGLYTYTRRIFGVNNVKNIEICNNTIYLDGQFSPYQEFLHTDNGTIDRLVNKNNIYIDVNNTVRAFLSVYRLKEYIATNNVYAASLYNNDSTERFLNSNIVVMSLPAYEEGFLYFNFEQRDLNAFKAAGYEDSSVSLDRIVQLLDIPSGYKLLPSLANTYIADIDYTPEFDKEYLRKGITATVGAFNLKGEQWDEATDDSTGYEGYNYADEAIFNDVVPYVAPADDLVRLHINSKQRGLFFKTVIVPESGDSILRFGQDIMLVLTCVHVEGMYVEDNIYTVIINNNSYESTGVF